MQSFEARLAAIEKSNRRWKWMTLTLALVLLSVTGIAAGTPEKDENVPEVIYARKFVAVNDRGEPVAFMGHSKNVGMVSVAGPGGDLLVVASATDNGDGIITTYNDEGHRLVTMGASHRGDGHVAIFDQDGKQILHQPRVQPTSSGAGIIKHRE
ncbi:MAG TPA: hypothetical protein VMV10_21895 [Pirellulales bacterium]|nr:hypothetical protein [Pirellulales bacterium]